MRNLILAGSASVLALVAVPATAQRSLSQGDVAKAQQQHPAIVQEFGGPMDARRNAYVGEVGRRIAGQSGVSGGGSAYTVTALNSPVLNAFAVPGGYVYVTRQLVGIMDDEAELAAVLGHEMGHIAARHSQRRQSRNMWSQLGAVLLGVVTGSNEIGQWAGQAAQLHILSYSRSQEYEADDLGVRYLAGAGYDPLGLAGLLRSLGEATTLESRVAGRDQRAAPSWAQSHPLSADRAARAQSQAARIGRRGGERNRDRFLSVIDGMTFDDDPAQGVIDGRTFRHPDLRLRFTVPAGFAMQNGTRAVTVTGSGGQAMFSGGGTAASFDAYIADVYRQLTGGRTRVDYPAPRTNSVNGIPVAFTIARVSTQQGVVDVGVMAYRFAQGSYYHFATVTRAGTGFAPFQSMIESVARLSPAEAAAIRPRVIDVVTVAPGDTVQRLASRMAYNDYRLERFLALNSLTSTSRLAPGSKVKLVVYGSR